MPTPSVADVKAHANKLAEELAAKSGKPLDSATLELAGLVPPFSKGTAPLTEDGQVIAPEAATSAVAIPDGEAAGSVDALAGAKQEIGAANEAPFAAETAAKPAKERDQKGRFVSEVAADIADQQPVASAEAPEAAAPSTEDKAQEILDRPDPFADYVDVEYDDPDLEQKVTVKVPKDKADIVKRGYSRQADYTRKTMGLAAARKTLGPMIESGAFQQIAPIIERANSDPDFAQYIVDAFNRVQQGLPLTVAQQQAVEAVQAAAAPAQAQTPVPALTEEQDPFWAQQMAPYNTKLDEVTNLVKSLAQREAEAQAAQARQVAENQRRANVAYQAHMELTRRFPDTFKGDLAHDQNEFNRAISYARDAGYLNTYGENPLAIVLGYEDLQRARAEASASPAAAAIEQAQAKRVAQVNAASVPTGTTKAEPVKKAPPAPPPTRVNGVAADPKAYAAAQIARLRAAQAQGP